MKSYNVLIVIALTLTLFTACKKDDGVVDNYNSSYKAWMKFKSSVNNTYEYAVVSGSWTGFSSETIITVSKGVVVQRAYTAAKTNGQNGTKTIMKQWIEQANTLNTHSEGASTFTLDEVYRKAKNEWLVNSKNTDTFFEAKNQGMLSIAGFNEKGCVDDCFNGIHISFIRKISSEL